MDSFNAMDMTKLDQASAATRQKSCNACVRGKRKCDKQMPRCTRCAAKGLDCLYKKLPSESSSPPTSHGGSAAASMSTENACSVSDVPEFDMSFDMESLGTDTSPESLQPDGVGLHQLDPALDFNIVDLMAESAGTDFWNLHGFGNVGKLDLPPVPVAPVAPLREPIRELQPYNGNECVQAMDPLTVHDPRTPIGYITQYLAGMHAPFSQTRCLPFMHPRLWAGSARMPQTILSAFAAATAYAGRTPENRSWVLKLVADAAREVHREGERQGLSASEKLARVQALLVLAAMRVFDGDIGARAAVEREMVVFRAWMEDLISVLKDELEHGLQAEVNISRDRPPKSWEVRFTTSS